MNMPYLGVWLYGHEPARVGLGPGDGAGTGGVPGAYLRGADIGLEAVEQCDISA